MISNMSLQQQPVAFASVAASTDSHLLPISSTRSTWYAAPSTTLILFSPASGIMPCIGVGSLPRKVSYSDCGKDERDLTEGVMMNFKSLAERAAGIRRRYAEFERSRYGRAWTDEEIALGFVGDVGDLVKLVQAKNGVRDIPDVDQRLAHELADCLWSVFTLAERYHIDLEQAFLKTMDEIEQHLGDKTDSAN